MNSKLTAEGIMGAAMRMGAELSGGEFPISVFPHKIQRIITELHASQGYPIDYIAAAMLSALAVSIGNSHLAQVKRGWVESPILYMALIGRPGANKSHPLSFAFHPFIEHDYHHNKEYQEQYTEYERTMSMTKKERLEAVGVEGTPSEMAEQFELQTMLNDKVKNTVGHISLNFSAEDAARLATDDKLMLKIAHDYMKLMGIENTQFIIARHIDRDHPHCHIVYNRVDNDGRTISDKNDRFRNEKVCKMLTARYRLHFSEGKKNVKFDRLRKHDQVKHYIYHVLRHEVPKAVSWSELRRALRRYKIDTEFKLNRRTCEVEGVKFICNGYKFSGSKIDRQFSFVNIACRLEENAFDAGIYPRRNSTPTQQCVEPRQEIVRQEPSEESSLSAGLLDLTTAPTTDPEEEMLAKQYVKKKKKPQRKRGFRL